MDVIGIGDIHLDKLTRVIPSANELSVKAVRRVLRYALENGVTNIIFYGDICDVPRMSYSALVHFYKTLFDPKFKDLVFHIILGNHDFAEDGTHSLELFAEIARLSGNNIHVYTKPTNIVIEGMPFRMLPYPYTDTDKKYVNVGHFDMAGAVRDNGRKIEEGFSTAHTCLVGHLHTPQTVRNTHYSGTLYQTNFGESLPKFFHHVTAEGNKSGEIEVQQVPFEPPWKLLNVKVSGPDDLKDLVEDGSHVYYKLFIETGVQIDLNEVMQRYPNIVKTNVYRSNKELQLMMKEGWKLDQDMIQQRVVEIDLDQVLLKLLKGEGLNGSQVKRAIQILESIEV